MGYIQDTIFAPSTAIGGAIAVIRISGPKAGDAEMLLERSVTDKPGRLLFTRLKSGTEVIDDVMAVYFRGPHSYTGEDMMEINCHGGPQTVQRTLQLLSSCGFRPAEGGEFTRRAFLNGKMDLSQAEAVMDIITADAEKSRKIALEQLHGSVSRAVHSAEQVLLDALAAMDAAIDYPEEVEEDCMEELPHQIADAKRVLCDLIANGRAGRVLRDGARVVILGKPNVGKSSILNAFSGRDRAIVTAIAGTTRDVLDEKVVFDGVPIRLIDTAGIHGTDNEIEQIGIDRAMGEVERADVILAVHDCSQPLSEEDLELIETAKNSGREWILVGNKCDLPHVPDPGTLYVSAKTGEGLEQLKKEITERVIPGETEDLCITNERHLLALENALAAVNAAGEGTEIDCIATDIRTALHHLGSITGSDVDADVIDRIFEKFCVGK
ncbi:MAG: tRNA uridine-5-carboxymethylaminomethyl(34) synthesis GTPase MnmE [Clostridia bacterium]|nr:tRNA uridine-5-carboxymethylaminomethyl(34) synthesis GTPase MnmE [Clostridia bacterium]